MGSEIDSRPHEGKEKLPEARQTPSGHFDLMDAIRDRSSVVVSSPAVTAFETALGETMEAGPKLKRIWLLRHFDFEKTTTGERYRDLSSKNRNELKDGEPRELAGLNETIGIDFDDARGHSVLDAVCRTCTNSKISIFTDSSDKILKRNRQTLDVIQDRFADKVAVLEAPLTPPKTGHLGESLILSAEMIRELIGRAKNSDGDAVLLGNRTFSPMFSIHADRMLTSPVEAIADFANIRYDYLDFDAETGEIVTKSDRKTLPLTPDNYAGTLRTILGTERAERYGTHSLPLLQEVVNRALRILSETDARAYEATLFELAKSDSGKGLGKGEIQAYVFDRLMELGTDVAKIDTVDWSDAAIGLFSPSKHREFLIRHLGEKDDRPSSLPNLFARHARTKGGAEVLEDATRYWEIRQKQKRSVDPAVRSKGGFYLERKVNSLRLEDGMPVSLDTARLFDALESRSFFIRGIAGEGKTSWICEQAKRAILAGFPVGFHSCKDLDPEWLRPGGKIFEEWRKNQNKFFFFDAADEVIDASERKEMLESIAKMNVRCVTTARKGTELPKGRSYSELSSIGRKTYFEAKFPDGAWKTVLQSYESLRMEDELKDSPIILSLFASLAEAERTNENEFEKFGIEGIERIRNSYALYENVAKYVVGLHEKFGRGAQMTPARLEKRLSELSDYAIALSKGEVRKGADEDFDQYHGLLERNSEGAYEFSHLSLYAFFVARSFTSSESVSEWYRWTKEIERESNGPSSFLVWGIQNAQAHAIVFGAEKFEKMGDWNALEGLLEKVSNTDGKGGGSLLALKIIRNMETKGLGGELEGARKKILGGLSELPPESLMNFMPKAGYYFDNVGYDEDLDEAIFGNVIKFAKESDPKSEEMIRACCHESENEPFMRYETKTKEDEYVMWDPKTKGAEGVIHVALACGSRIGRVLAKDAFPSSENDYFRVQCILETVRRYGGKAAKEDFEMRTWEKFFYDHLLGHYDKDFLVSDIKDYCERIKTSPNATPPQNFGYALARIVFASRHVVEDSEVDDLENLAGEMQELIRRCAKEDPAFPKEEKIHEFFELFDSVFESVNGKFWAVMRSQMFFSIGNNA